MSVTTQNAPEGLAGPLFGPETVKFFSFVLAAGMSVPINLLVRMGLSLVAPYEAAVVIAHFAGMAAAFFATKLFVFEASGRPVGSEMVRFAMVNAVSLAQTWIVAVGLVRFAFPAAGMTFHPELTAHVIGLGSTAVTSYLLHRYFSFRHSRQTAAGQPTEAKGSGNAPSFSA